jgi:hypothetical protein
MNNTYEPTPHDVFLNVRKAYRLLHDYQRMVLDGVRYIEAQLDIQYNGGWRLFTDNAAGTGFTKLDQSTDSWDGLPMMWFEFYFVKEIESGWLNLSLFIISDTGYIEGEAEVGDTDNWSAFVPAEGSASKFFFILRKTNSWTGRELFPFMNGKLQMRDLIKEGGFLPNDLVGKCYDMSCLTSEDEANKVVKDIVSFAKEKSWLLEKRKK